MNLSSNKGMKSKFGKKFRILAAIENENVRLLTLLLNTQNHRPEVPVDKLGNNIFMVACAMGKLQMVQFIYDTYHLDIHQYNTDGMNSMHLAAYGGHIDVVKWLWEHGADCHAKTIYYNRTSYDFVCEMLQKNDPPDGYNTMTKDIRKKLVELKNFLRARYFEDQRGYEIRKFIWVYSKLKGKSDDIGKLPVGIIQEIAEYF
jgi:hypothetical protein